jgi:peptidoglycan/xylan/chitin deacetylase (PgdA/CDA1 family)
VQKLPILLYHKIDEIPPGARHVRNYVPPKQFESQLGALKLWGFTPIALEDWLRLRAAGTGMPSRPVVLTFDDGYRSNYEIAWPILRHYEAGATIFLVADRMGETNRWDADELQEPLLGPAEVRAMQAGGISFGSHTCTHRSLIHLTEKEALEELTLSRAKLEMLLGRPVTTLAYPYNNNNRRVRRLARTAGYQAAVLGRGKVNAPWTSLWALRRIQVDSQTTIEELRHRLFSWRHLAWI